VAGTYYAHIMASASRVLYAGVTNKIERRTFQHKEGRVSGFSARHKTRELVYMEAFADLRPAIARVKQIKGRLRVKNPALIRSANPGWVDLRPTGARRGGKGARTSRKVSF
jgi:putative endonuclease